MWVTRKLHVATAGEQGNVYLQKKRQKTIGEGKINGAI